MLLIPKVSILPEQTPIFIWDVSSVIQQLLSWSQRPDKVRMGNLGTGVGLVKISKFLSAKSINVGFLSFRY